jgi:hypothetical protein
MERLVAGKATDLFDSAENVPFAAIEMAKGMLDEFGGCCLDLHAISNGHSLLIMGELILDRHDLIRYTGVCWCGVFICGGLLFVTHSSSLLLTILYYHHSQPSHTTHTHSNPLTTTYHSGLGLDRECVRRFFTAAEAAYGQNRYHCSVHAADVGKL